MKFLVIFAVALFCLNAPAEVRQCYNLIKPQSRNVSRLLTNVETVKGLNLNNFLAKQSFDFQKVLAISLWNYLVVLKNNDVAVSELKDKWAQAEKDNRIPQSLAPSVYVDTNAQALAHLHANDLRAYDQKVEVAWRSVVRAAILKSTSADVKLLDAPNSVSRFLDHATDEQDQKVKFFISYVLESIYLKAEAKDTYNFLTKMVDQGKTDFAALRNSQCPAEDPVAQRIVRSYYQRAITVPFTAATYLMTYDCSERDGADASVTGCLDYFKKNLQVLGCAAYDVPDCRRDQKTLKISCYVETKNCFNTYRVSDLHLVDRSDLPPSGFMISADRTPHRFYCKLVE